MSTRRCSGLLLAVTGLALLAHARGGGSVHVVTNGMDLQAAVDAAASGDTLLIRAGSYSSGASIDGKGLTLVADGPVAPLLGGGVRIANLAASQRVVLSGLDVLGQPWTGPGTGRALTVNNAVGAMRVDRCSFTGREVGLGAVIANAVDFTATQSQFLGGNTAVWPSLNEFLIAGGGLAASGGGHVALYACLARGAHALDAVAYSDGQWGGIGAYVQGGRFHAAASDFVGGRGGRPLGQCTFGGNGGDGLHLSAPQSARSIASSFSGGLGAQGNNCFCAGCFNGEGGAPFEGPLVSLATTPTALELPRIAREATTVSITIHTPSGSHGVLVASQQTAHGLESAYNGPVLVKGPYELRMSLGPIASGSSSLSVALPSLPAGVESQTWFFQVIVRTPGFGATAGECRPLVIVDDAF